jgi:H+-transporting ATPase
MSILCSDKTGTLTTAKMSIIGGSIFSGDGFTATDVVKYAYLCSNADKKEDPIDRAIVIAFNDNEEAKKAVEGYKQDYMMGFNPEVKRVVSFVSKPDGHSITIAKGLPAKIVDTEAGGKDEHEIQWKVDKYQDTAFLNQIRDKDKELSSAGYKTIGIAMCEGDARNEEKVVWKFVGLLPMLDPPRADTARTIHSLHNANISVKMITGDHVNVGKETARLIGLGTDIKPGEAIRNATDPEVRKQLIWEADGFAAVLPSDKREVVLTLRNHYGIVTGMTGDGVNDAAALSAAQVGIAVQGATDAAKNAADLILTEPGLAPIYGAVLESRRIFARIKSYVVYRIAASIILVCTLSTIIFAKGCAVNSLLVIILALLNDISMIPVAYDRASATARPQRPIAKKLVLMSLFYGVCHSCFGLIFIFTLDHGKPLKESANINLVTCPKQTQGFIWLHLVLVTELAIFSARAPGLFFRSIPSAALFVSVISTCILGTFIARYAQKVPGSNIGWIWLYNVVALFFVDFFKIKFRELIGDPPGDTIDSDEPIEIVEMTEEKKFEEKKLRYAIHTESALPAHELTHSIEIITNDKNDMIGMFVSQLGELNRMRISDGFVQKQRRTRSSSFPPPSGVPSKS